MKKRKSSKALENLDESLKSRNEVRTKIIELQTLVPIINESIDLDVRLRGSLINQPDFLREDQNSDLSKSLEKSRNYWAEVNAGAIALIELSSSTDSMGTINATAFSNYVEGVVIAHPKNLSVQLWGSDWLSQIESHKIAYGMPEDIQKRLTLIDDYLNTKYPQRNTQKKLSELYIDAVQKTELFRAGNEPFQVYEAQRELLDQFKGAINLFCGGKSRIKNEDVYTAASRLLAHDDYARQLIINGGNELNSMKDRCDSVLHFRPKNIPQTELKHFLNQIEFYVKSITGALDPKKVGIIFTTS